MVSRADKSLVAKRTPNKSIGPLEERSQQSERSAVRLLRKVSWTGLLKKQ
jgi:hypothetical protein